MLSLSHVFEFWKGSGPINCWLHVFPLRPYFLLDVFLSLTVLLSSFLFIYFSFPYPFLKSLEFFFNLYLFLSFSLFLSLMALAGKPTTYPLHNTSSLTLFFPISLYFLLFSYFVHLLIQPKSSKKSYFLYFFFLFFYSTHLLLQQCLSRNFVTLQWCLMRNFDGVVVVFGEKFWRRPSRRTLRSLWICLPFFFLFLFIYYSLQEIYTIMSFLVMTKVIFGYFSLVFILWWSRPSRVL